MRALLPAVLLLSFGLTSCLETETPGAAPKLTLYTPQTSATTANLGVVVSNATASGGGWTVQPSQECGGPDGPVKASGSLIWADSKHGGASVPASSADLITVTVQTSAGVLTARDCVTIP